MKEGDAFIQKLRLEQLKQWANEVDRAEKDLLRIIRDSAIFRKPEQFKQHGFIPYMHIRN